MLNHELAVIAFKLGGNNRSVNLREGVNVLLLYVLSADWLAAIPKELRPRPTAYGYFDFWDWDGTLMRIHKPLRRLPRKRGPGRQPDRWNDR